MLEQHVLETWPVWVRTEANSGAKYRENDLVTHTHSIECKRKLSQDSVSLSKGEITQCQERASSRMREPLWVIETKLGKFVVTEYSDFIRMVEELDESGEKEDDDFNYTRQAARISRGEDDSAP